MKLCGFFFPYKLVIISKYIYSSQQKFWCYIFKCLRELTSSMWLFTLPQILIQDMQPHQWTSRIYTGNITYVVMQFTWNGPFSWGVHTKYVRRCACSHRHTAAYTARILLACVCMCYLYMKKNACVSQSASLGRRRQKRVKADTHSYVWEWLLHTLSCQCEKDSCRLLVLQPLILHLMGRG